MAYHVRRNTLFEASGINFVFKITCVFIGVAAAVIFFGGGLGMLLYALVTNSKTYLFNNFTIFYTYNLIYFTDAISYKGFCMANSQCKINMNCIKGTCVCNDFATLRNSKCGK
jgi:hypothetical protein